jgi:hypothetical protein
MSVVTPGDTIERELYRQLTGAASLTRDHSQSASARALLAALGADPLASAGMTASVFLVVSSPDHIFAKFSDR